MNDPFANGFYRRLFTDLPSAELARVTPALTELGVAMRFNAQFDKDPLNEDLSLLPRAGYTYFAQFVDHDLSQDATPLELTGPALEGIVNRQSARLDLDHLYGGGPRCSPHLYEPDVAPEVARFRLGRTVPGGLARDLPREGARAVTGDDRRTENLLLSQLTAAFLRFHNAVLERVIANPDAFAGPAWGTPFERTWHTVTWHYQWLVRNDLLTKVLAPDIRSRLLKQPDPHFLPPAGGPFRIPLEFAHAAFRYGHSLVRNSYEINSRLTPPPENYQDHTVTLEQILDPGAFLTTDPAGNVGLRDEWIVDWRNFFSGPSNLDAPLPLSTFRLDTRLADALHRVPAQFTLGAEQPPPQLPVRTLLRGARLDLPSGQDVARALGEKPLEADELFINPGDADILRRHSFDRATPLYFYLLREGETRGGRMHLGPVGSRIVGGTLFGALHADPRSFVNAAGLNWVPELGGKERFNMWDLLVIAGVDSPTRP